MLFLSTFAANSLRMSDFSHIIDFVNPVNLSLISNDEVYKEGQIGKIIDLYEDHLPSIENADIVLVGCNEARGSGITRKVKSAPDSIRRQFYQLFYWHPDIRLADVGNVKKGASLADTYAALKTVLKELISGGKTVIILGGSHDLTLSQYRAYADNKQVIEAVCIDAKVNISMEIPEPSENFLLEMLTEEPNYTYNYNHIGFQSYLVHPRILETMDKLRFDCFRLGRVKESIEEMEPVIRNCHLFSFDISALANAFAPASAISPNGFDGEQACVLMRYAGMSSNTNTIGVYGYNPDKDRDNLTSKQISHMLWYAIEGKSRGREEASLEEKESFNEYYTTFAEVNTVFLQSKRTSRWWMQLPDKKFIPCSYKDYLLASSNEYPERWLRAQERV